MSIESAVRLIRTIIFIAFQAPFFLTVLFFNALLLNPSNWVMKRNRALFATLSAAMWIPFLGLSVDTQISQHLVFKKSKAIKLFLCTHQSFSDAVVLALIFWMFRHELGGPGVALYKQELGKLPILGAIQRYSGNIPVARSGDVDAAKRSLGEAARRAREGYHVSGFPEGSRRRTASTGTRSQIQPLKKGFFHLVNDLLSQQDTIIEIYPVVFVGSFRSWPKGHTVPVRDAKVLIRIGDPVVIEKPCDVDAIKDQMSHKLGVELETAWSISSESTKLNLWSIFGFETICSVIPTIGFIFSLFR